MTTDLAIIILAAGKGTRMKSQLPKVLHPLAHRPMVLHVLDAIAPLEPSKTIVITGHGADDVEATIEAAYPGTTCVRQAEQLGTGHAVLQTEEALQGFTGTVLILCGDVPLVETDALEEFLEDHQAQGNVVSVASATVEDPTGLGRILRDNTGRLITIKEHKDCNDDEREITEVNVGQYVVDGTQLFPLLKRVTNDNVQAEYYLPDILKIALADGQPVNAIDFNQDPEELGGINNRVQLAMAEQSLQERYAHMHMTNGATLQDPASVQFAWDTQLGQDVTIEPHVVFGPGVRVADGVTIKAFSHLEGATVGKGCIIGPHARLRPKTELAEHVEIGCFVVTKKAKIGAKTKAKQLNCLVDCTIGERVNIGAGAVFANYHHFKKEKQNSTVGDDASIGSDAVLVAPVTVGEKAFVGAGAVVRKDVPANALMVDKPEQLTKENYADKFKKG